MVKKSKQTSDDIPEEIKDLQQQIADLTEALLRERADALNLRRRHDEQVAGLKDMVKVDVVKKLLPVIDNFDRALKHVPKELESNDYVKGIQGVVRQFEKVMHDMGVQRIKTIGEPFDPHFHEAVSMDDGEGADEVVTEELQSGYMIGDTTVIRHAMVRVGRR